MKLVSPDPNVYPNHRGSGMLAGLYFEEFFEGQTFEHELRKNTDGS